VTYEEKDKGPLKKKHDRKRDEKKMGRRRRREREALTGKKGKRHRGRGGTNIGGGQVRL